jgi:hypothetical protein
MASTDSPQMTVGHALAVEQPKEREGRSGDVEPRKQAARVTGGLKQIPVDPAVAAREGFDFLPQQGLPVRQVPATCGASR